MFDEWINYVPFDLLLLLLNRIERKEIITIQSFILSKIIFLMNTKFALSTYVFVSYRNGPLSQ